MSPRAESRDDPQPIVFQDFLAGLWERGNDRECPPNGLLECTDCWPLETGGVRAAWAWREEPAGNYPTNRRVIGFALDPEPITSEVRVGLMLGTTQTNSTGQFTYEYWFAQGSGTTSITDVTTWTSGRQHGGNYGLIPTRFARFQRTADTPWYYNVGLSTGVLTSGGVHRLDVGLASTVTTQVATEAVFFLAAHQERLVYVTSAAGGIWNQLRFTNPSTDTAPPSSNIMLVAPHQIGHITYLEAGYPEDLYVVKQNSGGLIIQGELGAGSLTREMTVAHAPERLAWGVRIPLGIAYPTEHDGIWVWSGGAEQSHLSRQILGSPMVGVVLNPRGAAEALNTVTSPGFLGSLGHGGRWLFTPKGYVFDFVGNVWFRTTLPGNRVYSHWAFDSVEQRIYGAGYREPGDDARIVSTLMDQRTMTRAGSFRLTLPLIDMAERNVELRRIEMFGQGFGNGGTWQLELSNDRGETETTEVATVAARAASARFNTKLQGDWLKVRLLSDGAADASSPTGKSEAPMVKRLVAYVRPRTTRPS